MEAIMTRVENSVREHRLRLGMTQEELARQSGINAKNISMLENDRIDIGKRRAEQLAKAFKVHPAIIMFPEYEGELIQQAA